MAAALIHAFWDVWQGEAWARMRGAAPADPGTKISVCQRRRRHGYRRRHDPHAERAAINAGVSLNQGGGRHLFDSGTEPVRRKARRSPVPAGAPTKSVKPLLLLGRGVLQFSKKDGSQ